MPPVKVVFYLEDDHTVPMLEWLDSLPDKALAKCLVRIERLKQEGHELRRPEADLLRDGIYELRIAWSGIQYRMLYFFLGQTVVVLSHGIIKKVSAVPGIEIERAKERRDKFIANPQFHTYEELS